MPRNSRRVPVLNGRHAGVLLHPSSLPDSVGTGDFGPQAYHFVDFLKTCAASVWQILPLGPTHSDRSPYMGLSVLAGNPYLISPQLLVDCGWLDHSELDYSSGDDPWLFRRRCLKVASKGFKQHATKSEHQAWLSFIDKQSNWLADFALFQALREENQSQAWTNWPKKLRDRDPVALKEARRRLDEDIKQIYFEQFVFFKQWLALKAYSNQNGVRILGDMPIFVAHDSAEVWSNREYFDLSENGKPLTVAGVPPDYFSKTGQLWGNPHYNWQRMRDDDFKWWVERLRVILELYDFVRVDHFRGFQAYWEIKATAKTAVNGRWVKAPGRALFNTLLKKFETLPFVAEDLGMITPQVNSLRKKYAWPGMKILQFAFDSDSKNAYLPHNYTENCVVYTGTHDNDTTLGWYENLDSKTRDNVNKYLGPSEEKMPWPLIRCALASTAKLAIIPMQDLLGFGASHRMNTPGETQGNWQWRFEWQQVADGVPNQFRQMIKLYDR